jgi:hypothetical protein
MPDETGRGQEARVNRLLMPAAVFVVSVIDSFDPANGSGAEIGGVGLVSSSRWGCSCWALCSCWSGGGATRPSSGASRCVTTPQH